VSIEPRLYGILLTLCLAASPVQAENPILQRELQGVLEAFLLENDQAPGLSACVICPAMELDWSGAAGTAAKGDSMPLTAAHTFRIASNTKTYVAAAVLRLVEMGHLGLEDSLSQHITAEQNGLLRSDGYNTDVITVAQLLSHTAGLGDHTDDPRYAERIEADPQHRWSAEEQLRLLVEWRDPVGEPGEKHKYSDTGYIVLGTIIERITGRSLSTAVRDLLDYDGLGLKVTHWEYMEAAPALAGPRAHQYYGEQDVTSWHASFDLYGGGGIITDCRELTLFMRMLLKGSVFVHESTLANMTTRGVLPYRLGLMVLECNGRLAFGHQGFWNTFAFHVPSLDLTVGGSVLNHEATNGRELMCGLVAAVVAAAGGQAK
jgi:D-alanyl-D-alanine carboxypeptidase